MAPTWWSLSVTTPAHETTRSEAIRALVLAGGVGARLRPATVAWCRDHRVWWQRLIDRAPPADGTVWWWRP